MDMEYFNSTDYTGDRRLDIMSEAESYTMPIVVNSVLLCIGVCTNILMIWSLYKSWKTGSRMHFYLLVICVADLLGLCVRSGVNIGVYSTVVWRGGYYGCKIFSGLQMFGATISHLILAGFNIDNLFTIACSRSIKTLRIVFLILSFVTAVIISGVKFHFYRLVTQGSINEASFCFVEGFFVLPLVETGAYFLLLFLVMLLFGLPSLFVWCCKKGTLSIQKMTTTDDSYTDFQFIGRDIGIVLAYDVVFILCCVPFVVFFVMGSPVAIALTVSTLQEAANPCLNPFIYAIFLCIGRRRDRTSPGL